jgi:hypothetical protein
VPRGLLGIVAPTHQDTCERVVRTFRRVEDTLWQSYQQLDDAARQYDECERGNEEFLGRAWSREDVERADASIGAVKRPPVDRWTGGPGGFLVDSAALPERHLVAPQNLVKDDPLKVLTDAVDNVSAAVQILKVIEHICGFNPVEEVSDLLAGDWKQYGQCADVWRRLGLAAKDVSYYVWRGNRCSYGCCRS